jgi:hydroxymethylbilane synthase
LRRVAQFKRLRDDLEYQNIRGNLQTRLRKLEEGQYQAIILAAAGVHRLGWKPRIAQYFDPITESIPAVGQGILAVEFREADQWVQEKLAPLALPAVQAAMQAERAMLRTLEGGCQVPIGGYAKPQDEAGTSFVLHGIVLDLDGTRAIKCELPFEPANAEATGIAAAHQLMAEGAEDILNSLATRGI